MLTFTAEVERIWRRKFTGATIVYLLLRYSIILDRILFSTEVLLWSSEDKTCGIIEHSDDIALTVNYLATSALIIVRTYAISGRDWRIFLVAVPLALIKPVLEIDESLHYSPVQAGPPLGCVLDWTLTDNQSLVTFAGVAFETASNLLLILITSVKTFAIKRELSRLSIPAPLTTLLIRDGEHYSSIFAMVWPYFNQCFSVMILTRFMLDLRGLYFPDNTSSQGSSSLVFRALSKVHVTSANMVGTLGATVRTGTDHSLSPDELEWEADGLGDEEPQFSLDPFREGMEAEL
ncbi:hypothetical protein BD311DRAFT_768143 [Dichomitus squalens]|uniref:DUF6533 domain-containing protein n=1 Tax=Dichomitus squalens TaxID=114155 RepID=A0A4Q9M8Z6_9APHY|nr:hypothetical protein BD311DRAFT_768143 [Dichomitus squalens]